MESLTSIKFQSLPKILLLLAFLTLLTLIPFISPPMRSPYLYFLLNLLIIVLAIEAGFLSYSSSKPARDDHKNKPPLALLIPASQPTITTTTTTSSSSSSSSRASGHGGEMINMESNKPLMKRCKSRPSLFFIGSYEEEEEEDYEEKKVEVEEEVEVDQLVKKKREVELEMMMMSKQELFMKAEVFIGNFYKQLKMQREESWNKLHGLYHKN